MLKNKKNKIQLQKQCQPTALKTNRNRDGPKKERNTADIQHYKQATKCGDSKNKLTTTNLLPKTA